MVLKEPGEIRGDTVEEHTLIKVDSGIDIDWKRKQNRYQLVHTPRTN